MVLKIEFNSDAAIYIQLRNQIIMGIATEMIHEGDTLPSVRQMAAELSINPNTIQKAYGVLEQEGYIFPVKGRGSFVAEAAAVREKRRQLSMDKLDACLREVRELGFGRQECVKEVDKIYGEGQR